MSKHEQFRIGDQVVCAGGACGELGRVVVDPVARTLTHLVVRPKPRRGLDRLVPISAVDVAGPPIQLRCTRASFDAFEEAEEIRFLSGGAHEWGYGPGESLSWPYYGLGMAGLGEGIGAMGVANMAQPVVRDRIPLGEVQVRRGDKVQATDGAIGSVQGLVIEPSEHHVTHILLQEGHLWVRKQVAIPIGALTSVDDGILLTLTKQEVKDLPSIRLLD